MASAYVVGPEEHILTLSAYSISQKSILGQGTFGIVFNGRDSKNNTPIAAKRIDGNLYPRILTQDLNRLMKLDHQHVTEILYIEKTGNIIWIMTPLCHLGDLSNFYRTRCVLHRTSLEVMKQIMMGISYLHSQGIIHRDIKPGNILVASDSPIVKLNDFDVSKCLDPEVEMSNVAALAFKAPEFFRTGPEQIEYHKNVDIYAAGLTFLAILQAGQGQRQFLIPQIETPVYGSDLSVPSIGQLIAERIRCNIQELNIVKKGGELWYLKDLIREMTCVNPTQRLSASQVSEKLNKC